MRRAQAVIDDLVSRGFNAPLISGAGVGESQLPIVQTTMKRPSKLRGCADVIQAVRVAFIIPGPLGELDRPGAVEAQLWVAVERVGKPGRVSAAVFVFGESRASLT